LDMYLSLGGWEVLMRKLGCVVGSSTCTLVLSIATGSMELDYGTGSWLIFRYIRYQCHYFGLATLVPTQFLSKREARSDLDTM